MKSIITIILIFFAFVSKSQTTSLPSTINYKSLEYFVLDRDTNTIECVKGNYGESNYISYDSTYIFAHIIYPNLPMTFNQDSLSMRTKQVMIIENIQMSYIWRDTKSLWMLPFSHRSEEMRKEENISSIGWMMKQDKHIRFNPK